MHIKLKFPLLLLCIASMMNAQNWNVFNKQYRYNYKFDNSAIVSNVLFADSVKQSGQDTLYYLNRIVTECLSNCPYDTTGNPNHKYYYANMPQFLQRSIKKFSNGLVNLFDTTAMYIKPTCGLSETWIFDSVYNVQAVCHAISLQTIFGVQDSVRTILLNNTDTIKLSKNFGLIVFPEPYAKNKYYRLSGIEWKNSYDQTALYGEKVPNAWDFYNLQVGDTLSSFEGSSSTMSYSVKIKKTIIQGKTILNNGYQYLCEVFVFQPNPPIPSSYGNPCNVSSTPPGSVSTTSLIFPNLNDPNKIENSIYPGQLIRTGTKQTAVNSYYFPFAAIGRLISDGQFRNYKTTANLCQSYTLPVLPSVSPTNIKEIDVDYYRNIVPLIEYSRITFGETFGLIAYSAFHFETNADYLLSSLSRNGIRYFGVPNTLSVPDLAMQRQPEIYPNPAGDFLNILIDKETQVKICDVWGKVVLDKIIWNKSRIDLGELPPGLYFLELKTDNILSVHKIIVER